MDTAIISFWILTNNKESWGVDAFLDLFRKFFWLAFISLPKNHSHLRLAVLSSLLISIFHGLVNNIGLRTIFTELSFFVPGMAVCLVTYTKSKAQRVSDKSWRLQLTVPVMIALALIIIGLITLRRPLISA